MIIGGKTCRSCEYRHVVGRETFCRRYPPTVHAVPMQTANGPAIGFQSAFPSVNPDWPCGEYRRSDLFAQQEVGEAQAVAAMSVKQ